MSKLLITGNAINIPLADKSVQCVVTSPPYYGLRDYGISGQIGLEQTPEEYAANLVKVFREVWRVLRDDGTLWLNLGDSYWGAKGASSQAWSSEHQDRDTLEKPYHQITGKGETRPTDRGHDSIKGKDLIGIPWMVAFALRADGWYLRSDIIWHKPNPMPESVRDRPTKSHEYIFLMTKSQRYYYDQDAVREEQQVESRLRLTRGWNGNSDKGYPNGPQNHLQKYMGKFTEDEAMNLPGRNRRSVWTIATSPYSGAHFAAFPPKLIEPCILAGTSAKGKCPKCGAPWFREKIKTGEVQRRWSTNNAEGSPYEKQSSMQNTYDLSDWKPSCKCLDAEGNPFTPVPCVVLDPFSGSGTTVAKALELGRHGVGLDLNQEYCTKLATKRTKNVQIRMSLE